jgi:hypothetical protein
MQNISSSSELKNAIRLLEVEQAEAGLIFKEHLRLTVKSFRPVNLLASTLGDVAKSPYLVDNILGTAMGLATGYFSKKIFIGESANRIKKIIGSILQFGITSVVAQNSDSIKTFGQSLLQHFFRRKEINTEKP